MLGYLLRAHVKGFLPPGPAGIRASLHLLRCDLNRFQSSRLETCLGFVLRMCEKLSVLRSAVSTQQLETVNVWIEK